MTTETLIAIVSAFFAIISALAAWHSAVSAKRALKLAEIDHKEKHESVKIHLIDSVFWQNKELEKIVSFACRLTNGANTPNTITHMVMIVHAYSEAGSLSKVTLEPALEDAQGNRMKQLPDFS
jgi:hypothetical protein